MPVSTFKIKRSSGTTAPTDLAQGELALTYGAGTHTNMGDRLFIGTGDEYSGVAEFLDVIGGKYYTEMLDHLKGVATADSAVILDENRKINEWRVDKVEIDGASIFIDAEAVAGTDFAIDVNGTDALKLNTNRSGATVSIGHTTSETTVNDNLTVTGNLAVNGISTFAGNLGLTGEVDITGDLDVDNINLNGNAITTTTGVLSIDPDGTSALQLGTATSGSIISIGHTTSETTVNDNLTVVGDLIVNGTQTTLNVATITVDDKNIELGAVTTPTDTTADLGGLTLKGTTDKTISWHNADDRWHFNQGIDIDAGDFITAGSSTLNGTLQVDGVANFSSATTVDNTLSITGASSYIHLPDSTEIHVGTANDLSIYHNATDSYITNTTGSLKIATETSGVPVVIGHTTSETKIADNLTVDGNALINGNLTVEGLSSLNGGTITIGDADTDSVVFAADVNSNVLPNTDGTYDLGSSTKEWKDIFIDGTAHIDTLDVDENATVAGTLGVTGATTLSSTLGVTAATTLSNTLGVTGATTLSSTLDVTGNTGIDGDFDIATNKFTVAAATGNTEVAGTLDVTGNTTLDADLSVAGNAAITGDFSITGALNQTSHIDMPDNAHVKLGTGDDLQLYHNGTDSYVTNSTGTLKIGTETTAVPISIGHATSETTINDNLTVTGNALVSGNLTVEGLSTMNGGTLQLGDSDTDNVVFGADVNSNIIPNTDGAYDLGAASKEWKDLFIDGTAHIDTLDVDADATVAGTLGVTGVINPTTHIDMPDGANLKLGTGDDMQLYHDGTDSHIDNATGTLNIATATSAVPVSIGHTTSETTINDNLTVTGDATINGATLDVNADVEITGTSTIIGAVDITGDLDVDNINLNGNTIISTDSNGHINLTPNGTGTVIVESAVLNTDVAGSAVLDDDTFGTASSTTLATSESIKTYVDTQITAEDLDLTTDSGTIAIDLDSETLSIVGGEGMNTSATGNIVTVEGEDASTSNKGVASFQSTHFDVTAGAVNIQANAIDDTLIDWGTGTNQVSTDDVPEGASNLWYTDERVDDRVSNLVVDGEGITTTYNDGAGTFTIDAEDATDSNKGVASFANTDFTVTTGAVGIKALGVSNAQLAGSIANAKLVNSTIVLGSDTVNLGDTITDVNGLTQLDVDNIRVDANTISSTDTNGDIVLDPNGTGSVDVNSARIINLADPTQTTDAVTKQYVDAVKSGLDIKDSVRMATTANLSGTYANGTAGVGATLTNNSTQAAFAVDGVSASLNDRVLVKDQTAQAENGIYTVTTVGSGAANWVLTRATDADGDPSQELDGGTFVFVEEGSIAQDNGYTFTHNGVPTIGTTALPVAQFSGAGQVIAGDALTKSGNTLDVAVDNASIEVVADALQVKSLGIQNSMIANSTVGNNKLQNKSVTINSNNLELGGTLTLDTDDFAEGTNIFFTNERVDDRINSLVQDGEGITTTYDDAANTFTIAAEDATDSNKGVASFASGDFAVTTGAVAIKSAGVDNAQLANNSVTINGNVIALGGSVTLDSDDIAQGSTNLYTSPEAIDDRVNQLVQDGEGITTTYDDAANTFTIAAEDASSSNKGIATFNTADFSVTGGDVTIKNLGVTSAQLFGGIDLASKVAGTLPVANGGTGDVTWAAGGVMYGDDANDLKVTAAGTGGYFLYSNAGTPDWTNTIDGGTY